MERAFLEEQLAAGRSLEQIGALVRKHPSTVGYWVKKHGLRAVHHDKYAPNGRADSKRLRELVARGLTVAELARRLDVSTSTVNYWLKKLGLQTQRGVSKSRAAAARRAGIQRLPATCPRHGPMTFRITKGGTYRCARCSSEAVAARRRRVKQILMAEAGGACRRCGFAEHPAALHFHHLDPTTKSFAVSGAGVTRSVARARAEAQKCVLLCSNCHALVEAGVTSL